MNGHAIALTTTFGVATYDGSDVPALIARADQALLRGKELGRNRVVVFSETGEKEDPRPIAASGP